MASSGIAFDHYTSSLTGIVFRPEAVRSDSRIREDGRVFDKAIYSQEVHGPIDLFSTGKFLEQAYPRCLDMPLRLAGDYYYRLPMEWMGLMPLIKRIVSLEAASNPSWHEYHTYLTVDSSPVEAGVTQRRGGLHVDGFQGARIDPKTKVTRNYVASSNGGTHFYPQLFDASFDDSTYDIFKGFDAQAGKPMVAPSHRVLFMDAYTVHESGPAEQAGLRTFLRVTFDLKRFDRLGNTRNAMLSYDWPMVGRNVQESLIPPL